jgi:hypothetical protein
MRRNTWRSEQGDRYEQVAGAIRKVNGAWEPIEYGAHAPVGQWWVASVTSSAITIAFPPKLAVVTQSSGADEAFAYNDGLVEGPSLGIDKAVFKGRNKNGPFNPLNAPDNESANLWFDLQFIIEFAEEATA